MTGRTGASLRTHLRATGVPAISVCFIRSIDLSKSSNPGAGRYYRAAAGTA